MFGLIKKDILMIRNNLKSLLFAIVIYFFFGLMNDMDVSFILPFMTVMISLSTFSYDDFNHWHAYAATLPNGRKNVVKGKYIATLSLTAIATLFAIGMTFIIGNIKHTLDITESLSSIGGSLFAIIMLMSILYPIFFKYGAEKGRIALFMVSFGLGAVAFCINALVPKAVKLKIIRNLILLFARYGEILFVAISIVMILISYFVSKKIYLKKEF